MKNTLASENTTHTIALCPASRVYIPRELALAWGLNFFSVTCRLDDAQAIGGFVPLKLEGGLLSGRWDRWEEIVFADLPFPCDGDGVTYEPAGSVET
jgi:hypothetical protein